MGAYAISAASAIWFLPWSLQFNCLTIGEPHSVCIHGIWSCLCWVPDFGYMGAWKGLKAFKRIIVAWLIIHLNTYYSIMSRYQSVHIIVDMTLTLIPKSTEQSLWESLLSKWAQSLKTSTMAVVLVAAIPFLTEVISSSRIKVIFQLIKKGKE